MNRFKFLVKEFFAACWETIKLPFWLFGVGWKRLMGFGPGALDWFCLRRRLSFFFHYYSLSRSHRSRRFAARAM
jgi:hypothetical protein